MVKLRKITGSLKVGSKHLESFLCGQLAYVRSVCIVIQSSDFWKREERSEWSSYISSGPRGRTSWVTPSTTLHIVEDNGLSKGNPSVLCWKGEAWSVWLDTTEVLHIEIEYIEIMLWRQMCVLCGLVMFTVAGTCNKLKEGRVWLPIRGAGHHGGASKATGASLKPLVTSQSALRK